MSMALLLGLIWSGLWMVYLYVIMKCFPWEMLHDYPEDVRKASTLPEPTGEKDLSAKGNICLYSFASHSSVGNRADNASMKEKSMVLWL